MRIYCTFLSTRHSEVVVPHQRTIDVPINSLNNVKNQSKFMTAIKHCMEQDTLLSIPDKEFER